MSSVETLIKTRLDNYVSTQLSGNSNYDTFDVFIGVMSDDLTRKSVFIYQDGFFQQSSHAAAITYPMVNVDCIGFNYKSVAELSKEINDNLHGALNLTGSNLGTINIITAANGNNYKGISPDGKYYLKCNSYNLIYFNT